MFFHCPNQLNPTTTNTPIPDRPLTRPPARFLILVPTAKYLEEISPDLEASMWSPYIPDIDHKDIDLYQDYFKFTFVVDLSSF